MKKILFISVLVSTFNIIGSGVWAQTTTLSDEFTLEEIVVTAEKREINVQELPSSVVAISGIDLAEQGKISTAQMLENIPNVKWGAGPQGNPDGGIEIRGIRFKQTSDGRSPSATATYVDGIFQGIGGQFDVNRIEVLRGPQGTLYGRSATGGVVAFHTNNPILSEFSANISAQIGEADLRDAQVAVNIPLGDVFAVRVAGHWNEQDGYYNPDGGHSQTKEGRIKMLYHASDSLDIVLSGTVNDRRNNSGGFGARLVTPSTINYKATDIAVAEGTPLVALQGSLSINYDFGDSTLAYTGAVHTYEDTKSTGSLMSMPSMIMESLPNTPGDTYHTQEIRWISDSDGWWTWIIGANYYALDYENSNTTTQMIAFLPGPGQLQDPNPNTINALQGTQSFSGKHTNKGFFTEETFNMGDKTRLTAGLRYDDTVIDGFASFYGNQNQTADGNFLNPPILGGISLFKTLKYDNFTYKFRLEYDITPDNMLYFLTATGFQPGDIRITPRFVFGPPGTPPTQTFEDLPYDEEKLTSYEVGSKNRFFDDRLHVNISAFYYDYEGYRNTINLSTFGPPWYSIVPTPLRMYGSELAIDLLATENDRLSLSLGYLDAEVTEFPNIPSVGDTRDFMVLTEIPGQSKLTGNLVYDHNFSFADGSILVPRAELRYKDGFYLSNMTQQQLDLGQLPYSYQDSYVIGNIGATWTSSSGRFSVTANVRNVTDKEYKSSVSLSTNSTGLNTVTAGEPRSWSLMLSARF